MNKYLILHSLILNRDYFFVGDKLNGMILIQFLKNGDQICKSITTDEQGMMEFEFTCQNYLSEIEAIEFRESFSVRDTASVVSDIKLAMEASDTARRFFSKAFISWFRDREDCNLGDYQRLDKTNRKLFIEMVNIKGGDYDEEPLFDLEGFCFAHVAKK